MQVDRQKIGLHQYIGVYNLDNFADFKKIDPILESYLANVANKINIGDVKEGWKLTLLIVYNHTDFISAYKRATRYPSDKEVEVGIAIPIPTLAQAEYGLKKSCFGNFFKPKENTRHILEPDYDHYETLDDYIIASVKRAVDEMFTHGITVTGKKIKFLEKP